ncbi:hypothetical protein BGX38DRAFT_1261327 [Terfezia claveryi]|nr:hypothetical protein BGX38DRAFT_1261327 [Terfezia claveryi]
MPGKVTGHPQPPSPTPPPPPLDGYESDASKTTAPFENEKNEALSIFPNLLTGLTKMRGLVENQDRWDFYIDGVLRQFEEEFGLTVTNHDFSSIRETAKRYTKVLSPPQALPPTPPPVIDTSTQITMATETEADNQQHLHQYTHVCRGSNHHHPTITASTTKGQGQSACESDTTPDYPHPKTNQNPPPMRVQAVVLHAAPTKYKPGLMRRWIEEDNKTAQIQGNSLAFKGGQKDREAGIITGHLHDGDNRPYTWAPHGQEIIPNYDIQLGELGRFTVLFLLTHITSTGEGRDREDHFYTYDTFLYFSTGEGLLWDTIARFYFSSTCEGFC